MTRKVVIALGSNLGEKERNLRDAASAIARRIGEPLAVSSAYRTKPLLLPGGEPQPDYLNATLLTESEAPAREILTALLDIELELGRDRANETRWGPRVIDLDLIAVGELVIREPGLVVPHPEYHRRDFVLCPMVEICPDFLHPLHRKRPSELLAELRESGVESNIIETFALQLR